MRRRFFTHSIAGCTPQRRTLCTTVTTTTRRAFEHHPRIHAWTRGVPVSQAAERQLMQTCELGGDVVHPHLAVMPDVHVGVGCTVGVVLPTRSVIIPAAVGVDIGCGIVACRTSLRANDLPSDLKDLRMAIECAIPHGRTHNGASEADVGGWRGQYPPAVVDAWNRELAVEFEALCAHHPKLARSNNINHLGTLGTGNHFIELCLECSASTSATSENPSTQENNPSLWIMIHSGSRGIGNLIGMTYIELAHQDMRTHQIQLPVQDLAYIRKGSEHFDAYLRAVSWAQRYAHVNRRVMLQAVVKALREPSMRLPPVRLLPERAVNCHHNYVNREVHYGEELYVTRKGAISARAGELGIIPGNMGAKSYLVRGKGVPESFCSASHGAGRALSRGEARRKYTVDDHITAVAGVECRTDQDVLDETPMAYKDIDAVMRAQADLVEVVTCIKQILCVKG